MKRHTSCGTPIITHARNVHGSIFTCLLQLKCVVEPYIEDMVSAMAMEMNKSECERLDAVFR